MSTDRGLKPPQRDFSSHSGAVLSINEVAESVDPETELVPPKKNTNSGGSHNSNVPISAHIIAQDAQLSRALASKIPLGIFRQGPPQNLCGSEVLALKEPTKSKINVGRIPKPKPSGALTSKRENNKPSGRENAAPDDTCAKCITLPLAAALEKMKETPLSTDT
ncbi:hypothetical protein B0H13DRAFT_1851245 [Mycena leptocephala]|nr:hypothetical protein B0H13DRAFT_1851245 [Mycena leptocephala]